MALLEQFLLPRFKPGYYREGILVFRRRLKATSTADMRRLAGYLQSLIARSSFEPISDREIGYIVISPRPPSYTYYRGKPPTEFLHGWIRLEESSSITISGYIHWVTLPAAAAVASILLAIITGITGFLSGLPLGSPLLIFWVIVLLSGPALIAVFIQRRSVYQWFHIIVRGIIDLSRR